MTNHWRDIRHADLILINGANPAEAHPVGFQWMMRAKLERGAKMIHADPRFTRTSAVADTHLRIRTGTDVAYFGGLINYVLKNELYHKDYVQYATNAAFVVKEGYAFKDGLFNGYDPQKRVYDTTAWTYETGPDGFAKTDIQHPRSVLNLMREHYRRDTPEMVARITGIPKDQFLQVAKLVGETGRPDKGGTVVYAVGDGHQRVRLRLPAQAGDERLLAVNLRPGAAREDGRADAVRDDRDEHRARLQPGAAGAVEPQVAVRHGRVRHHQFGVLARSRYRRPHGADRGAHAPGHPLDREGRVVHQQRPLGAVEGADPAAAGRGPPRPLDPRRGLPADPGALPAAGRQVPRAGSGPHLPVPGSPQARAGRDRPGDQRIRPRHRQAAGHLRRPQGRRHHERGRLDLHRALQIG